MSKGSLADPGHQQSLGEANVIQDPGVFVMGWKGFIANTFLVMSWTSRWLQQAKKIRQHVA